MSTSAPDASGGISTAARAACDSAIRLLQPYAGQDGRIQPIIERLSALLAETVNKADRVAGELAKVDRAVAELTMAGAMSPMDRAQNAAANRSAELEYLAEMSPAAAAAWEARG
jgi:ABC-type transporter Mla subunit MlaD